MMAFGKDMTEDRLLQSGNFVGLTSIDFFSACDADRVYLS